MTREDAKNYILSHATTDYLERDKSGKGWLCPICGSGSGPDGTGITTQGDGHYTCWAGGCFKHADILEIIGKKYGLVDYNSILEKACTLFGISIDNSYSGNNQPKKEEPTHTHTDIHIHKEKEPAKTVDYRDFFLKATKDIEKTDYHRGISLATLKANWVGYVENYQEHNKGAKGWNCLIIPTSKESYVIRNTDPSAETGNRYRKQGVSHLFNDKKALEQKEKPIIIVEGELDALSILDAGGVAIGLGSVSNAKALLSTLEANRPEQPIILAMDKDEAGEKANKELEEGLTALGIECYSMDIAGTCKDANEALIKDREAFTARIQEANNTEETKLEADREAFTVRIQEANNIEETKLEADREAVEAESAFYSMPAFQQAIKDSETDAYIPTGFAELDRLLDGGLYAGLYCVGAISSLGKTTFITQIADYVAKHGRSVYLFSLEMSKYELMAKSISRLTFKKDKTEDLKLAKTVRGIQTGSRYSKYSEAEKKIIEEAEVEYRDTIAKNVYIMEGLGDVTTDRIRAKALKHTKIMGKPPVIVVDYLQIITPKDVRATDKQSIDSNVLELKRLSRDLNTPVIAISSFNRDNYNTPVNLASFKESGAVEYGSDVLIALQYDGMDYREGEGKEARDKRIRSLIKDNQKNAQEKKSQEIQVKVLKNRNGSKGSCRLYYYPMFNHFSELTMVDYKGNVITAGSNGEYDFSQLEDMPI